MTCLCSIVRALGWSDYSETPGQGDQAGQAWLQTIAVRVESETEERVIVWASRHVAVSTLIAIPSTSLLSRSRSSCAVLCCLCFCPDLLSNGQIVVPWRSRYSSAGSVVIFHRWQRLLIFKRYSHIWRFASNGISNHAFVGHFCVPANDKLFDLFGNFSWKLQWCLYIALNYNIWSTLSTHFALWSSILFAFVPREYVREPGLVWKYQWYICQW